VIDEGSEIIVDGKGTAHKMMDGVIGMSKG
jgi:hypothetical protein